MKKHVYNITNKIAYFKKVVKNMDLYDEIKEKRYDSHNVHYDEFLDNDSHTILQIKTESNYTGMLHWIDLIQNEKLYKAIEHLSEEEKYFISLVFYENITQDEMANIFNINQSSVFYKLNKIISKIKNYISKK